MDITGTRVVGIFAAGLAAAAFTGFVAIPAVAGAVAPEPATVQQAQPLQEDDPGWDCRSMGNHVCGVTGQDNAVYQVHYDGNGFVDWVQPRHIPAS